MVASARPRGCRVSRPLRGAQPRSSQGHIFGYSVTIQTLSYWCSESLLTLVALIPRILQATPDGDVGKEWSSTYSSCGFLKAAQPRSMKHSCDCRTLLLKSRKYTAPEVLSRTTACRRVKRCAGLDVLRRARRLRCRPGCFRGDVCRRDGEHEGGGGHAIVACR